MCIEIPFFGVIFLIEECSGWLMCDAAEFFTQLPLTSVPAGYVGFCAAAE